MESTKCYETLFGNAAVTRNISESIKFQFKEIANKSGELYRDGLHRNEFPRPKLFVYPIHAVVAEKTEAIVRFGLANSRLKDYFDFQMIFKMEEIDENTLVNSIIATFTQRGTEISSAVPSGLSSEYLLDQRNRTQWRAFLHKNELGDEELETAVQETSINTRSNSSQSV